MFFARRFFRSNLVAARGSGRGGILPRGGMIGPVSSEKLGRGRQARISPHRRRMAFEFLEARSLLTATWTQLSNPAPIAAPAGSCTIELLPNGSVLMADGTNSSTTGPTNKWAILTPDASGDYADGTWTEAANANFTRIDNASQVLSDGDVLVAGGEYGNGTDSAELYKPLNNTWSVLPSQPYGAFSDSISMVITGGTLNGDVMIAPVGSTNGYTAIFNPSTDTWSQGPKLYRGVNAEEQSWVKLADGSILTCDGNGTSERYIPSENQWVDAGAVPVNLWDSLGEIGPALLMNNGAAIFFGANGNTAIYNPADPPSPWSAGESLPSGYGCDDAPAAMLRDGTILLATGPAGTYNGPTKFFIYNPSNANSHFSLAPNQPRVSGSPFASQMLALPDGNALVRTPAGTYEFNPGDSASATALADRPTITSITRNASESLLLTGTELNGISAGAAYGDDAQMDSNYPLVQLTNGSETYFAATYNWSSTGVMLGSASETVDFTLPLGIPAGNYTVYAVANGIPSTPGYPLTVSTTANNSPPTVATPASATATTVTGTTVGLSVLGADDGGQSNLTYTWTAATSSISTPLPTFSDNGDNTAQSVTVKFQQAGTYTFTVTITDTGGLSVTSSVTVTVVQTPTLVATPGSLVVSTQSQEQFSATIDDQFGNVLNSSPPVTWRAANGSITAAGLYTSPSAGGADTITAQSGVLTATASVSVAAPVGWWKLNEGTSATAHDLGQSPNDNGAITASSWAQSSTATDEPYALAFNGSSTVVNLGQPSKLQISGQITISAWIKPSSITTQQFIIAGGSSYNTYTFLDLTGGYYEVGSDNGAYHLAAHQIPSGDLNTWVLLTGTYDGSTWRLYRDGIQVASTADAVGAVTTGGGWEIGAAGNTSYFSGDISNVRVYSTAISAAGIAALAAQPPTVAVWAAASPNPVSGTTTALSVLGADDDGASTLTYTWATTGTPPAPVTFSTNGTNAAGNTTATFNSVGTYNFQVTITNVAGYTATSSVSVTLTAVPVNGVWAASGGGTFSWGTGSNWQGGVAPGAAGDTDDIAVLGVAVGSGTATITLGASQTLSSLTFSPAAGGSYALSGSNSLQLANSGSSASISETSGSNAINAPVVLDDNVNVTAATGTSLAISGPISQSGGSHGVTLSGGGSLALSGTNTYTGGTIVSAGTLLMKSPDAIPEGGSLTIGAGGTFVFDPSVTASSSTTTVPDAMTAAIFSATSTTSAVPRSTDRVSSSLILLVPTEAARSASGSAATPSLASVLATVATPPVTLPLPTLALGLQTDSLRKSVPTCDFGTSAADQLAASSTAKRIAGELASLGQAANNSDNSDQQRKKDVAILALDAVFAQYDR
ncbi:MAG: LamG-like jellyroll fold domain-containing protein [Thermoguttaceae bacterium]